MNDDDSTREMPERPEDEPDEPRTEQPLNLDQPTVDHPPPTRAGDESIPTPTQIPPLDPLQTGDPNPTITHEIPGPGFVPWMLPRVPSEVPGYELLSLIGRGGLSAVYRARHQEYGIEVAIKVFNFQSSTEAQREVQRRVVTRLARLRHPNVASTYGLGALDEYPYLVMELIEGQTLSRLHAQSEFGIRETVSLMEQIARGVGYLHKHGILHRDLKPANILVDSEGRPRVTDFGLAMCLLEEGVEIWPEDGAIVGTPHFMPPEQVQGRIASFGPPMDVWALGVTMHWMLTGSHLFPHQSIANLLVAVLHDELPALRSLRADAPADLEAICRRCLQRDPAQRYPDANALADDLRLFLSGASLPRPQPRKRPWWAFWRKNEDV
jgi:serine/threonine protein kinase